jgi:hypothetical protein
MEAVPHMRKLVLAGGIAALMGLGTSAPAFAGGCSNSSSSPPSSVSQYVEQQPTACGNQATGQGTATRKVPKQIQTKIDKLGGEDAPALTNIVSKQAYGAPTGSTIKVHTVKVKGHKNSKGSGPSKILSDSETRTSSHQNPLAASVGVITDGSDGRLIALVVLMAAVAGVIVFSALRRRRITR